MEDCFIYRGEEKGGSPVNGEWFHLPKEGKIYLTGKWSANVSMETKEEILATVEKNLRAVLFKIMNGSQIISGFVCWG